ncbi:MAG: glycosyltransferase family 2 protein [Ignavibacteria bacterium]|nr:glycosyltransferase family 2 protein [Ignavibacteria bacterium]MBT8381593.1 glycosyltransferase family 2 protein [Ignavibacteria bacterium]MBT8391984.1 glycosyltransferase family 2 protein [Ignavibacteria bacterium]NNJ53156.1 glycosyltransferase family 2 protein [Ignavibacteriaceae bacterium]NNL21045.1 glycosyltransferase family 2 protein [Ignavibacteriaceae bacterium]
MTTPLNSISIVIPAKNEEKTIGEMVTAATKYSDDIIVINGNSEDKTSEYAAAAGARVINIPPIGKGNALCESIQHIKNKITVFMDADGSHIPEDIPKLVQPILVGEADHVSGSRLLGGSDELHGTFDETLRLMGSSLITACINWKFNIKLSESQNGFRAIRTDVLKKLNLKEKITTIEQEMIIKTLKLGYRMAEVPTHERRRFYGESNINLRKVSFRYVYSFIKYLFFTKSKKGH